jgi:retinol dehydrogenase-12
VDVNACRKCWFRFFCIRTFLTPLQKLLGQKPEIGAYTQLYAGLQSDLDCHKADTWSKSRVVPVQLVVEFLTCLQVVPPGKLAPGRKDLFDADLGRKYWEWNEEQISPYM